MYTRDTDTVPTAGGGGREGAWRDPHATGRAWRSVSLLGRQNLAGLGSQHFLFIYFFLFGVVDDE